MGSLFLCILGVQTKHMKLLSLLFLCVPLLSFGQKTKQVTYLSTGDTSLKLEILQGEGQNQENSSPAIVFFFGGGWTGGTIEQFRPQAEYLANRGMVAILVEYRTYNSHQTSPFECRVRLYIGFDSSRITLLAMHHIAG